MDCPSSAKRKAPTALTSDHLKKANTLDYTGYTNQPHGLDDDQVTGENLKRFNSATLVVQQRQKVTVAKPQRDFDFILALPKVPGRRCTVRSLNKKLANFILRIVESGTTDFLSATDPNKYGKGSTGLLSVNFPVKDYSKEEVQSLIPLTLELLDRWPWPQVKAPALVRYVTASKLPRHPLHYPPIGNSRSAEFNTSIVCIDPQTGGFHVWNCFTSANCVTNIEIPPISSNIIFGTPKGKRERNVGEEDHPAETYLKFLSSKLHLKVTTVENAKQLAEAYDRAYGYEMRSRGPYDGAWMWRFTTKDRVTTISPTKRVKNDILGSLPSIYVNSTKIRVLPVLNAIIQTWTQSEDILEAWKAGCRTADTVNAAITEGEVPIKVCHCEDPSSSGEVHPCAGCLRIMSCAEMRDDYKQDRICRLCAATPAKDFNHSAITHEGRVAKDSNPLVIAHEGHVAIYRAVRSNLWYEAKRCSIPHEVYSARVLPIWRSLQQHALIGGQWQDAYCLVDRRSVAGRNPFLPSFEAVFPYIVFEGKTQYHAPGNVVITALYINLLKHTYIPALLSHVANYIRSDRGPEAVKRFMMEMEDVYLISLRTPYNKKKRLSASVGSSEYASIKREWVTGLPGSHGHEKMQYTQKHYLHNPRKAPYPDWRPDGFERIRKLVFAIELNFPDQKLRRGPDGCPFPFHESEIPSDWSWWSCWRLFDERLARMEIWCNRHWDCRFYAICGRLLMRCTVDDTTETIFIECIWQILDINMTDKLFDLPISLYIRHPLRFAVAHRQHGIQLRSAWTKLQPEAIEDRDPSRCNMSIEASIVNYAKSNFPDELYPLMRKDFEKRLNLGPEFYDPGQRLSDTGQVRGLSVPDLEDIVAEDLDEEDEDFSREDDSGSE